MNYTELYFINKLWSFIHDLKSLYRKMKTFSMKTILQGVW